MSSFKFQDTVWCGHVLTTVMTARLPNTTPSYFVLIWVCTPDKQGHQISCPFTTFEGAHEGHGLLAKIADKRRTLIGNKFSSRCTKLCIQQGGDYFE